MEGNELEEVSVLKQYVLDMINAGKTQNEVVMDIERYYATI
jgi:hypothetical protein